MNAPTANIALLLFTRTAAEEVRYKKLIPAGSYGLKYGLAVKMVENSAAVLAGTGLPYFIFSSEQQKGESFGDRLHHAFSCLFSLGFKRVIAIGNDCPALRSQNIIQAAQVLNNQEIILGPDKAGGIYLLGLTRSVFQKCKSFAPIRWHTATVLSDAKDFFNRLAETTVLPLELNDLNNCRDFSLALKKKLFNSELYKFLKILLRLKKPLPTKQDIALFGSVLLRVLLFRGPPVNI